MALTGGGCFFIVFGVMSHVFRGWRWRQTLEPLGAYPKRSDCVDAIFISYATNLILPRVGEVSRCGILAKYDDVSFPNLWELWSPSGWWTPCVFFDYGTYLSGSDACVSPFLSGNGYKIPSLMHLLTSPWFYVSLFCVIGVLVLMYYLMRMLSFLRK